MKKTYCRDQQKDQDEGLPILIFASQEGRREALEFSPFEKNLSAFSKKTT